MTNTSNESEKSLNKLSRAGYGTDVNAFNKSLAFDKALDETSSEAIEAAFAAANNNVSLTESEEALGNALIESGVFDA